MKLASITVAYNPDMGELTDNVASYADNVDLLIIWDNSDRTQNDWQPFANRWPNSLIHVACGNKGLSEAYNTALDIARQHGCTHLMTMDQDSRFENFETYRKQVAECQDPSVGIFVSPINCGPGAHDSQEYLTWACQSSSTFTLKMIDDIGHFRDDLFIDMVDTEMSLKAYYAGYRILNLSGCNLIHRVGSGRSTKRLGKIINVSDYNPLRQYYMSRNRMLMWYQFPQDYSLRHKVQWLGKRFRIMAKIVLAENDKIRKLAAIICGLFWGSLNKAHPCPECFRPHQ